MRNIIVHFIDNGSTDNTLEVLINEISNANSKNLNLIKVPKNKGYGYGIKYGILNTNNKYICWTHADLQISAKDVQDLIQKFLLSNDRDNSIYMGKRKNRNTLDIFFITENVSRYLCQPALNMAKDPVEEPIKIISLGFVYFFSNSLRKAMTSYIIIELV